MSAATVLTLRMALCSNGYTPLPLFVVLAVTSASLKLRKDRLNGRCP
jgi:hypothetical protein